MSASPSLKRHAGADPNRQATPTGDKAATWETTGGLVAHAILDSSADPDRACTAVISLDTGKEVEQDRWADWLHLGNVVAGLAEKAVITTTRIYAEDESFLPPTNADVTAADESIAALLEDCFDDVRERTRRCGGSSRAHELDRRISSPAGPTGP